MIKPGKKRGVFDEQVVPCPLCGEFVTGLNRVVTLRHQCISVPGLLRGIKPMDGPTLPQVFHGCVGCLEKRFVDDPVGMWLLREWVWRRDVRYFGT